MKSLRFVFSSLEGSLFRAFFSESKLLASVEDDPDRAWTHPTKSFAFMQAAFTSALISALTGEESKSADSRRVLFIRTT